MYKLVVVLFTLNSVVMCNSLTEDNEPAASNFAPDDGNRYEFGITKKFGYNKKIVATYHGAVPQEASESYVNYIIHPIDKGGPIFNRKEANAKPARHPTVQETAESTNLFKSPIVVEEAQPVDPKDEYIGVRQLANKIDGDSVRTWFTIEEPKRKNVLDEEIQDIYLAWFEKEGPRSTTAEGRWKDLKNNFNTFYDDDISKVFGNEAVSNKYTDGKNKDNDDFGWFSDTPFKYEDKSDEESEEKDNLRDYYVYEPKNDFRRNFNFDDNDYGYRWWHEW